MKKLKLIKYPRKPKKTASIATKENYLTKCRDIDRMNSDRLKDAKKSADLDKKIESVSKGKAVCKSSTKRKAKKTKIKRTAKRKAVKRVTKSKATKRTKRRK